MAFGKGQGSKLQVVKYGFQKLVSFLFFHMQSLIADRGHYCQWIFFFQTFALRKVDVKGKRSGKHGLKSPPGQACLL